MALSQWALVSLEEARAWLKSSPSEDAALVEAINQATEAIEARCGRRLKAGDYVNQRVAGPFDAWLYPRWPLSGPIDRTKPITVSVDSQVQTIWKSEADGNPDDFDVAVYPEFFFRVTGWRVLSGSRNPYNVVLTFTGGFDPIPDDLKLACYYTLQRNFGTDQQKQMTDVVGTVSSPGGSVGWAPRTYVIPGAAEDILVQRYALVGAG